MPPMLDLPVQPISPELALVDRELVERMHVAIPPSEPAVPEPVLDLGEEDAREAMLRICELSDVNPPRTRRRLVLAVAVPAVLWTEALLLVASLVSYSSL